MAAEITYEFTADASLVTIRWGGNKHCEAKVSRATLESLILQAATDALTSGEALALTDKVSLGYGGELLTAQQANAALVALKEAQFYASQPK